MSLVKLPYCRVEVQVTETPFGVMEIDNPKVYDTPIPNRVIYRLDLLDILRDRLDTQCFDCRVLLYNMLAGNHGAYDCNEIFLSYYRKFPSFRKLVNDAYYYGDETASIFDRVVKPLREELNAHSENMHKILESAGGKYLIATHDKLYYGFKFQEMIPETLGGVVIC
mgnify:CR=1 FL=1